MKSLSFVLTVCLVLGAATGASAIDFNIKGQWLAGIARDSISPIKTVREGANMWVYDNVTHFNAGQRVRLQLDAVASESLSGTALFEIGPWTWGKGQSNAFMPDDRDDSAVNEFRQPVRTQRAYIDWMVPDTGLKIRMGLQGIVLPNKAGGSAVMDTDATGINASFRFNGHVGLTALWIRAVDIDKPQSVKGGSRHWRGTMDLFALMLPVSREGFAVIPWVMYGLQDKNMLDYYNHSDLNLSWSTGEGNLDYSLRPYPAAVDDKVGKAGKAFGSMVWAGLPLAVTAWDPLNIEADLNYGYVEGLGRYDAWSGGYDDTPRRSVLGSTERSGWVAKALVEYHRNWGVPGIFGWYGSGDDGNPKNGSERMPSLVPKGNFTSFLGAGGYAWMRQGYALDYSGTWGLGVQVRDVSLVEDIRHTLRVAYWGGTNSTSEIKYMPNSYAWAEGYGNGTSPYLTTRDGLLEFNLINSYQMYKNFDIDLELSYVVNFMNMDAWQKAGRRDSFFWKQNPWKVQLIFAYSF